MHQPFPKRQILVSSNMKEFADENFKLMKTVGHPNGYKTLREKKKLLVTSNFSFSHSVLKRPVLQIRKNQGLFGKGFPEHGTFEEET